MDVRQLRYFMAVAEERHITRAAEKLGIQQPPLSRFIKNIEAELDVRLFTRTPRGVELTEAGQTFHDEARKVLAGLENAIEVARSTARGERGRLCVGVTPTGPFVTLVPRVMHEFRQAFPSVSFTLEERLSGELIDLLRNGRVDACFLWTPRAEGLVNMPLLHDPLVVALPSVHPLAQPPNRPIPVMALANETFIVYGRKDGFGLYAATIIACRAAGFSPRFGQESPRLASALNLVAAGLGIFFVPSSIQRISMHGVIYRPLKGPNPPKSTLSLVSRRGDPSAVLGNFVSTVRRAARSRMSEV